VAVSPGDVDLAVGDPADLGRGGVHPARIPLMTTPMTGALPAMRYLPADPAGRLPVAGAVRHGIGEALRTLRGLARTPDLRGFLVAYLFFEDGVNTVVYFSAVFAGHTLGFTTTEVIGLYFAVQLSALAGARL
jgi:MFS-type transporter involved in bile tolerance (Atg22 family)